MKPRLKQMAFTLACALFLACGASAAEPLDDFGAFIEEARVNYDVPGVAVAVVKDGQVVFLEGYGVREAGQAGPVDADTIFQLASVSKAFTSAALGVLVDEGKLGWDEPVFGLLPGFVLHDPYATLNTTARDLLAHRSGLPEFTGDLLGNLGYDRAEVLRRARYLEPAVSFRAEAGYSNLGFLIAGMLAGAVDGSSWEDVMLSRLFEPLEMSRSGFGPMSLSSDDNMAVNHASDANGVVRTIPWADSVVFGPAGGVSSTARDLASWMQMLLAEGDFGGQRVLTAETVHEMFEPAMVAPVSFTETPPIDADAGYAFTLGWDTYHYQGHKIVEKGGALSGIRTVITLVPDQNLGVAVLANLNLTFLPEAVRAQVLEAYLGSSGRDLQAEIKEQHDVLLSMLFAPPVPTAGPGEATRPLEAYAGTFENDLYGRFTVAQEDEGLAVKAGPACYQAGLDHDSYDTFLLTFPGATTLPEQLTFTLDASGQAASFRTESFGTFELVEAAGGCS
jgi:CubicO group peptidase (beta-lactamase class C family)